MKKTGYDYSINRQTIDDPETMPLESVDMFGKLSITQSLLTSNKVESLTNISSNKPSYFIIYLE
jgi:hypothetical protein